MATRPGNSCEKRSQRRGPISIGTCAAFHRFAKHGAAADAVLAEPHQARSLGPLEPHPVTAELLDPRRHAEVRGEPRRQAVGIAYLPRQPADEEQFREVPQRISAPRPLFAQPDPGTDMADQRRFVFPVEADGRLRSRPGPIEEQAESMQKDVEEAGEGLVSGVELAVEGVLAEVDGQCAVRAEEADDPLHHRVGGSRFARAP
jgi:hypothetical protein